MNVRTYEEYLDDATLVLPNGQRRATRGQAHIVAEVEVDEELQERPLRVLEFGVSLHPGHGVSGPATFAAADGRRAEIVVEENGAVTVVTPFAMRRHA